MSQNHDARPCLAQPLKKFLVPANQPLKRIKIRDVIVLDLKGPARAVECAPIEGGGVIADLIDGLG